MTDLVTVTFDTPVQRGETTIASVQVRNPSSGELRGLTLMDVAQMKVDTMLKLLPRITLPALTEAEIARLSPADLMALSAEAAGFLLPRGQRPDSPEA